MCAHQARSVETEKKKKKQMIYNNTKKKKNKLRAIPAVGAQGEKASIRRPQRKARWPMACTSLWPRGPTKSFEVAQAAVARKVQMSGS